MRTDRNGVELGSIVSTRVVHGGSLVTSSPRVDIPRPEHQRVPRLAVESEILPSLSPGGQRDISPEHLLRAMPQELPLKMPPPPTMGAVDPEWDDWDEEGLAGSLGANHSDLLLTYYGNPARPHEPPTARDMARFSDVRRSAHLMTPDSVVHEPPGAFTSVTGPANPATAMHQPFPLAPAYVGDLPWIQSVGLYGAVDPGLG